MNWFKKITGWDVALAAIVIATIAAVWLSGCEGLNNIQPQQLGTLATQTEQLSYKVDEFQQQTKATLESLKSTGTIDANALAKVDKIQSGIDSVQAKTVQIAEAVKNAQYTNSSNGVTTVLEGARAANAATTPWNPYAPLIDLGLGIAAAVATVIARKNAQTATDATAKYDAHKQGVELTMKQVSASTSADVKAVETQLYQNIGNARQALGVTA